MVKLKPEMAFYGNWLLQVTPEGGEKFQVVKALHGSPYKNEYMGSDAFKYQLPKMDDKFNPKLPTAILYAKGAREYDLGMWKVEECMPKGSTKRYVLLRRERDLTEKESVFLRCVSQDAFRSKSETAHFQYLLRTKPADYTVVFEPTCTLGLGQEIVTHSKWNAWVADGYTIDFTITSPDLLFRISVESKCCKEDAITEEALDKCKALRDKGKMRVYTLYGHGGDRGWIDFGPPGSEPTFHDSCPIQWPTSRPVTTPQ